MVHREDLASVVGRVAIAPLFLLSGIGKVAAREATVAYAQSFGTPFPGLAYWFSVFVELGVTAALLFGFKTRLAAAVLAAYSVVAAFIFHTEFGDQNQLIHFMKDFAIAGGLLHVVAFGGGAISIDAALNRKSVRAGAPPAR